MHTQTSVAQSSTADRCQGPGQRNSSLPECQANEPRGRHGIAALGGTASSRDRASPYSSRGHRLRAARVTQFTGRLRHASTSPRACVQAEPIGQSARARLAPPGPRRGTCSVGRELLAPIFYGELLFSGVTSSRLRERTASSSSVRSRSHREGGQVPFEGGDLRAQAAEFVVCAQPGIGGHVGPHGAAEASLKPGQSGPQPAVLLLGVAQLRLQRGTGDVATGASPTTGYFVCCSLPT